jgi:hypothetical protein
MKKLMMTASTCALLLTANAWSSECVINPDSEVMDVVSAQGGSHDVYCGYVDQVQDVIIDVQKFSEDQTPVNILVRKYYNNASFDGGLNLQVPQQLFFSGDYGQEYGTTLMSNLTVVAHEYGHALLQNKIERELGPKFSIVKEYMRLHKELSQLDIAIAKNPESKEIADLLAKKNEFLKNNTPTTKFFILHAGYSELYADLVAAFSENNKDAILNALYFDSMSRDAFMGIQTRSFNSTLTSRHEKFMTEAHGYFAYTRNYIGKELWPSSKEDRRMFLKKIGDAIIAELAELLTTKQDLPNFKEGNKRLIKRLKTI